MMSQHPFHYPPIGGSPATTKVGTNPGSFAERPRIGTAYSFSSPDTPGMPAPSAITAMNYASARDKQRKTQLQAARAGLITPEMVRIAEREGHLTAEQVR